MEPPKEQCSSPTGTDNEKSSPEDINTKRMNRLLAYEGLKVESLRDQCSNHVGTDKEISSSGDISIKIRNRLLAYSPNLAQSWVLAAIAFLCGFLFEMFIHPFFFFFVRDIKKMFIINSIIPVIHFFIKAVTVVIIVSYLGKSYNYVPIAHKRQSLSLWLLLVPFVLSISLAVKPLTMWILMPDIVNVCTVEMFWYEFNLSCFFMSIIAGPVYKEWLYRGIILKGLLTHYSPLKAIVWSAVIFTVINAYPWHPAVTFCLALAIGWVYWRTRSLWLCIFMHSINSAASFLVRIILPDAFLQLNLKKNFAYTYVDIEYSYYVYAIAVATCVLTGLLIKKVIISPVAASDAQDCHG